MTYTTALKKRKLLTLPTRRAVWKESQRQLLLLIGSLLCAWGYVIFQVSSHLSPGGLGGISLIINHFTGWPVGLLFWLMNLPLLVLGFFYLGRWGFVIRTLIAATLFSLFTDLMILYLPPIMSAYPITEDLLLNTIYGAIVGGIGAGLVYRAGSTLGGTGILGRIVQQKTGLPLSQAYLMTDGGIIFLMGLVFGWEISLYSLMMLFLNGLASDYTLEGASSTRTVTIITNEPQRMTDALMEKLQRGVTYWEVTGGYSGEKRYMLLCTIYRPQVYKVKQVVKQIDPNAFVSIGISHHALGKGFVALK